MSSNTTLHPTASKGGAKKSKMVVTLHLSPDALAAFPSDAPATARKPFASHKLDASPSVPPPDSNNDKSSDSNNTPVPPNENDDNDPNSLAPPKGEGKRRRGGGALAGRKRAPPAIDPNAPPRERGRPGPKKKPRLPDGTIDRSTDPSKAPLAGHKLGPKANTGAINAGLRALDRSGKPCRKWERKGLQLKSFTGTVWGMSSWRAPARITFPGDVKSDDSGASSDAKPHESSAVGSERSQSGGGDAVNGGLTNGLESSPAPPVAA